MVMGVVLVECSYWWGWCDQMVMGAVLVGV